MVSSDMPVENAVDYAGILAILRYRWRLIVACIVGALIAAVIYLNVVPYRYAVELRVAPVTSGSGDGISSKLSSLGGLAAVAGVSLPDSAGSGSFKLFVEALHSRDIAEILARDPIIMHGVFYKDWDAQNRTWKVPQGFVHDLVSLAKPLIGLPYRPFAPPTAARLQQWMSEEIEVDQNLKSPVVTVTLMDRNPAFAVYFLQQLSAKIDTLLRQRALLRTDDYIRYLAARLPTITLAEQRVAIAQALGEQERLKMSASSTRPFAADVFEHAAASDRPKSPIPAKVLVIALILGIVVGIVAAFVLPRRVRATLATA